MVTPIRLLPALLAALVLAGCAAPARPLFFAAASLGELMEQALDGWGGDAEVHLAGSSTLRAQILRGAPADLLVAADRESAEGMGGDPVPLWRNELVVVVAAEGSPVRLSDLGELDCVAIADPRLAPAGRYARDALGVRGLWQSVRPHATGAPDVRAALAQVASGSCPAGIVYATDAAATERVRVAFPLSAGRPILYWGVVLEDGRGAPQARDFLAWLRGPEGSALAAAAGLRIVTEAGGGA